MKGALAVGVALVLAPVAGADEVIYDNTGSRTGSVSFTQLQIGDEVHPAGTARVVRELLVGLTQQGRQGTGDVQAWLYANDGPDGKPGTMLWESALMDDVAFTGGDDLIAFDVPDVEVPDAFTWTVRISDTQPVAVGLPHYDPPGVGGSPDHAWFGSPGSWTKLVLQNPVNFMARVIAAAACPADLDGSGDVGFGDLLLLLAAWGDCPGCPEDLDGDDAVDFNDLLILLAAWGPCKEP